MRREYKGQSNIYYTSNAGGTMDIRMTWVLTYILTEERCVQESNNKMT